MKNYDLKEIYAWPLTTRILIIGLLCVITFYLGDLWDISDLRSQLDKEQLKEQELKRQLVSAFDKQLAAKRIIMQYADLRNLLGKWQGKLVSEASQPALLNEILKLGAVNQLQFDQLQPQPEQQAPPYAITPLEIKVQGNYHQLAEFISQVANMQWIVLLDSFSIERNAGQPESANLSAIIKLQVYRFIGVKPAQTIKGKQAKGGMNDDKENAG